VSLVDIKAEQNQPGQPAQNDPAHDVRHLSAPQAAVVKIQRDHRQPRSERHQANGDTVIQAYMPRLDYLKKKVKWRQIIKIQNTKYRSFYISG
jgi:hypothetical protein